MSESEEEGGFDAFNDDTFGDGASTWEEESHEFLVAKATVEEDKPHGPPQSTNGLSGKPSAFPSKIDDYLLMLQEEVSSGLKIGAGGGSLSVPFVSHLGLGGASGFDTPPPSMPAMPSMLQRPPWNHFNNNPHGSNVSPNQNPEGSSQRFAQPPQQQNYGPRLYNNNNNGHHANHQQFQQRQYHQMPPANHYYQRRSQQQPHHQHYHQQQHRYNNNNNQYHHHHHHQQQHHHHHHSNGRSEASYYNDRNRETFGDELVDAHKQTFREQNQRYFHHQNNNNNNSSSSGMNSSHNNSKVLQDQTPSSRVLMTPDRVHANRVLNNRRTDNSTGDPEMDMRRNVRIMMTQKENDEYSGLMTATERQWILQIQLSQLKCENPFVDDYYYTVFNQKKKAAAEAKDVAALLSQQSGLKEAEEQQKSNSSKEASDSNNGSQSMEKKPVTTQLKRTEEGPQLLISEYSAQDDSHTYTPVQFDNSLGKLQVASVKAPRMAIEIGASGNEANDSSTSNAQKDSRKYKQTLLELEHLFFLVIEVEDSEKKLAALPTNTSVRNQVESERLEALAELRKRLSVETNVRRYILVRKGKTLLKRALRHLEQTGVNCVVSILFALLPTALRRDRDDHLLPELLPQFIEHFDSSPQSYVVHYLKLLNCGQGTSQGYLPTFKNILSSSSLGTTLLLLLVERLDSKGEEAPGLLEELDNALKDTPIIVPPVKGYSSLGNIDYSSEDPGFYRSQMEKVFHVQREG